MILLFPVRPDTIEMCVCMREDKQEQKEKTDNI